MGIKLNPSTPGGGGPVDWGALKEKILKGLDVAAEYRALGVRFSGGAPNAKGWWACHAIDRPDDHPSAAVHIPSGVYCDKGGEGGAVGFLDFALKHGDFGRWIEVIRHYAEVAGIPFGTPATHGGGRIREAIYEYLDERSELRYAVFRYRLPNGRKSFTQHPPDGKGGWVIGSGCMEGIEPLPYRLPDLLAADPAEEIYIVEGEKDAERLVAEGFLATTNHQGCNSTDATWSKPKFLRYFHDRTCLILPDNDPGGLKHARKVAGYLYGVARSVKVVELPGLAPKGDVSDWLDTGGTAEELCQLCHEAPEWTPEAEPIEVEAPAIPEAPDVPVEGVFSMATRADLGILRAEDVEDEPILWLDRDRVAIGKMHLTAGEGGDGKSQVEIAQIAAFTTGRPSPCGGEPYRVGTCIILAAEDGYADVVKPRLIASGADIRMVRFLTAKFTLKDRHGNPQIHPVDFQRLDYWDAVFALEGPIYFVADPIPAYLGEGVNDNRNIDVRAVLEPFGALCLEHGVAWSAVTHLGKSPDLKTPTHKILGSVAYANLARIVHVTARDPGDRGRRYWLQIKNNYAPLQPAFGFAIEGHDYQSDRGKEIRTSRVVFEATPSDIEAIDVMGKGPVKQMGQAAEDWLRDQFSTPGLHIASAEIFRRGEAMGFSRKMLYRLKKKMGIWATPVPNNGSKEWMWYRPILAESSEPMKEDEENPPAF